MKPPFLPNMPLFALGFRLFFALAGFSALFLMVIWSAFLKGELAAATYFPPSLWHAHELLLGYTVVVLTGFLLTAVDKNNTPLLTGRPLLSLALLWLYGRIVPFYEGLIPDEVIAAIDFSYLPLLVYRIFCVAFRSKNYTGIAGYAALFLLLMIANGLIHAQLLGIAGDSARLGIELSAATLVTALLWAAGKILPYITEKSLRGILIIKNPLLDVAAVASALVVFAMQLAGISGLWLAIAAVFASVANTARLGSWYVQKIWYVPLLWVLFTAYAWIIVAFVLTAFSAYGNVTPSAAWHAFTLGGIGIITLGMMARLALSHTGRAIRASNAAVLAFIAINVTSVVKILAPIALPAWYDIWLHLSIWLWLFAFSLFIYAYMPMLAKETLNASKN
jgi:uncharacterized protein involved in response to NO